MLGGELYLFGGLNAGPSKSLWALNVRERRWRPIPAKKGASPAPRQGHTMCCEIPNVPYIPRLSVVVRWFAAAAEEARVLLELLRCTTYGTSTNCGFLGSFKCVYNLPLPFLGSPALYRRYPTKPIFIINRALSCCLRSQQKPPHSNQVPNPTFPLRVRCQPSQRKAETRC